MSHAVSYLNYINKYQIVQSEVQDKVIQKTFYILTLIPCISALVFIQQSHQQHQTIDAYTAIRTKHKY
jgi:ABC-type transport system involved in multi-copper enzyme maturation permease subunit